MIRSHREPFWLALRRRLWTIPLMAVLFVVATATLPLLLLVALAADVVLRMRHRRPLTLVRAMLFGWVFLAVEMLVLFGLLIIWAVSGFGLLRKAELDMTYRLQYWWLGLLMGAFRRIFSLGLEVEGDEVVAPGPIILMVRHASIIDTLLPNLVVSRRRGIRLRYVLKSELLLAPTIDIGAHRLINHFVDRTGGDSASQVEFIRNLSADLPADEGVLIYPEGTRFTEEKRARVLESLRTRDPGLAESAERLHHVLPPRLGGTLALLDPLTPADVVVMAHVGLDGLATVKHVLDGSIVGGCIRVCFWRIPRGDIPVDREGRIDWLFDQWERVDAWIAEHRGA
jgi:1-acyl-sn-glycerol-3-phosphate acyltransferase